MKKICDPKLPDEEVSAYIELLEKNVPYPAPSDLVFWSDEDLSPKDIVEIALTYKEQQKREGCYAFSYAPLKS
ncbi:MULTISPECIES: hypothetical protein [Clostridia]|uniref:hypothetical protein n=1 Tax=Clostridia TaxID=186801 RepID=UPI000EA332A5|nr:hypothetical protein [Roseburia sp. 1XD42-34]RKI75288.1 hypothetical protein D7V87_16845 [Clostridium sp. 1xD42-85]